MSSKITLTETEIVPIQTGEDGPTPEELTRAEALVVSGHTTHCAARMVWGGGACEGLSCGQPLTFLSAALPVSGTISFSLPDDKEVLSFHPTEVRIFGVPMAPVPENAEAVWKAFSSWMNGIHREPLILPAREMELLAEIEQTKLKAEEASATLNRLQERFPTLIPALLEPGSNPDLYATQVEALVERLAYGKEECLHRGLLIPSFDLEAAKGLSSDEVRQRWPRSENCCPDCGSTVVGYADLAHFTAGDW
jgi:hypothetical protein